jgi:hypothetical protein
MAAMSKPPSITLVFVLEIFKFLSTVDSVPPMYPPIEYTMKPDRPNKTTNTFLLANLKWIQ